MSRYGSVRINSTFLSILFSVDVYYFCVFVFVLEHKQYNEEWQTNRDKINFKKILWFFKTPYWKILGVNEITYCSIFEDFWMKQLEDHKDLCLYLRYKVYYIVSYRFQCSELKSELCAMGELPMKDRRSKRKSVVFNMQSPI